MTDSARWEAVRCHDPSADGHFFYAVSTTGVYCRPSCASRPARRENVSFHQTTVSANAPDSGPANGVSPPSHHEPSERTALVTVACRTIESAEEMPELSELAIQAGVSLYHFHRLFKRIVGVTPKSYAAACRHSRVQDQLSSGSGVTESIYAAGFNASSRFYEVAPDILGMKPSAYRNGGHGEEVWHAVGRCSLGCVLVAATELGLCAILLGDDPAVLLADLKTRFPKARLLIPKPGFASWVDEVVRFVDVPPGLRGFSCLSIFEVQPFNVECGRHCARFLPAKQQAMEKSQNVWVIVTPYGLLPVPAPPMLLRLRSPAIGSWPRTGNSPVTAGVSIENGGSWSWNRNDFGETILDRTGSFCDVCFRARGFVGLDTDQRGT